MQDLKQKLNDQGLVGTLTIRETGQKIPLRFGRGETSKLCKLELGPTSTDVELRLVEIPTAVPGQPNMTLVLVSGAITAPVDQAEETAKLEAAVKADNDAKAKADAAAKEKADAEADAEAAKAKEKAEADALAAAKAKEDADAPIPNVSIPVEVPTSASQDVTPENKSSGGGRRGK